jgi:endonuclease/exonuclease/phosphatase family metal-dependent hydrolase
MAQGPGFGTALAGIVTAACGYFGWQSGWIDPSKATAWVSGKLGSNSAVTQTASGEDSTIAASGVLGTPGNAMPAGAAMPNGGAGWPVGQTPAIAAAQAMAFPQGAPAGYPPPAASAPPAAAASPPAAYAAQRPLRIATFNIENFGPTKASRPETMQVLAAIVGWCDLIAIQEISSSKRDVVGELVALVNQSGRRYSYAVSARVGRGNGAEQYAYVWDTERIEANPQSFFTVDDRNDRINREPFIGSFRAVTPQGNGFSFTMINVHTDPDEVPSEMKALAAVWENVRVYLAPEDDLMLVGDMNASARQLTPLQAFPGVDTIVGGFYTNAARNRDIDHIVIDHNATVEFTGRTGSIDFVQNMQLDPTLARGVSDHYPLWAEFSLYEGQSAGQMANGQAAWGGGVR